MQKNERKVTEHTDAILPSNKKVTFTSISRREFLYGAMAITGLMGIPSCLNVKNMNASDYYKSDREKAFDTFTAKYGGRQDYVEMGDKLFIGIKKWGEDYINSANKEPDTLKSKFVHIDCIKNLSIDAIAFVYQDNDFIGIYEGTHHTIAALFLYLLSYPGLFWGYGGMEYSENEQVPNFRLSRLPRSFNDFFSEKDIHQVFPKDPKIGQYALFLTNLSVQFIIRHEYAHLRHGHVDFLKNLATTSYILENNFVLQGGYSSIDIQALEMDADSYAIATSLAYALKCVKFREKIEPAFKKYYNTGVQALYDLFFAVYVTFRLFSDSSDFSEMSTKTHPPAMLRLIMMSSVIEEYLRNINETSLLEKLNQILTNAISNAENAINICIGLDTDYRLYQVKDILSEQAQNHIKQIMESWKKVRPDLLKYKRCKILAE